MNNECWEPVTGKGKGQYKDINNPNKRCHVKLNPDGSLKKLDVFVDKDNDGVHNHGYLNTEKGEAGYVKRK